MGFVKIHLFLIVLLACVGLISFPGLRGTVLADTNALTERHMNWQAPVNSGGVSVGRDALDGVLSADEEFVFEVSLPEYTEAVDVYVAVAIPNMGVFFVTAEGEVVPFNDNNFVPYAAGVTRVPSLSFDPIPIYHPISGCILPVGEYTVCSLVVPAETDISTWWLLGNTPGELNCYSFRIECGLGPVEQEDETGDEATETKVLSYRGVSQKYEELIFDYNYNGDNCSIDFHDGSEEVLLDNCKGSISHIFTKENVYNVELKSNGKVVGNSVVIIENEDNRWIGFVSSLNNYMEDNEDYNDIVKDGRIYIPPSLSNISYYWTKYRLIKPSLLNEIDGDNFTIIARIKAPSSEGGISCYDPSVGVMGENGKKAHVTFMSEGCTYYASIGAADWYQSGGSWNCNSEKSICEYADLSVLGRDFSSWRVVKMKVKDKKLSVYYENEKIYTMTYKGSVGKLVGISISFKGSGSIDWVKVYDNRGNLVYSEDF